MHMKGAQASKVNRWPVHSKHTPLLFVLLLTAFYTVTKTRGRREKTKLSKIISKDTSKNSLVCFNEVLHDN
jgi:hypothetical protein